MDRFGSFSAHVLWTLHYHARTAYLFTSSDLKTFVLPEAIFGFFGALSGPLLTTNSSPTFLEILKRLPLILLWTWLNTFVFVLSNQGSAPAIVEDSLNKPWRPLPAGRISLPQTRYLLMFSVPAILLITYCNLGGFEETAILFCLTWLYNDVGAANEVFHVRNAVIAAAYAFYGSGALRIASGVGEHTIRPSAYVWLAITSGIIFTTMSIQDLKDQAGDAARARRTAPLVIGEAKTRWTIAIAVPVWSIVCCVFWDVQLFVSAACVGAGVFIAVRVVAKKGFTADKDSWKMWSYWLIFLYGLPLCRRYSGW